MFCDAGGSRGRVQGVRTPPPEMKPSSYLLLKFVHLTGQWRHSLEVHPLPRKILDPPLQRYYFGSSCKPFSFLTIQFPEYKPLLKRCFPREYLKRKLSRPLSLSVRRTRSFPVFSNHHFISIKEGVEGALWKRKTAQKNRPKPAINFVRNWTPTKTLTDKALVGRLQNLFLLFNFHTSNLA